MLLHWREGRAWGRGQELLLWRKKARAGQLPQGLGGWPQQPRGGGAGCPWGPRSTGKLLPWLTGEDVRDRSMPEVAASEHQDETSRFCSPAGQLGLCCKDTLGQRVLCCHGLLESLGVRQLSGQSWFLWGLPFPFCPLPPQRKDFHRR